MELNALEAQEKNKSALKFRITFFFVFFLAAVFAVFVITSVLQVNTVTQFVCSRYALPVVEKAMGLIEPESFERLSKTLDPSDPYYTETQEKLFSIKMESNCLYLYTMAPEEGSVFQYVIDGSNIPGGKGFSELGELEDIGTWDSAAMEAFLTGQSQLGTVDQNDDYGATISAYEPIFNSSGEVIGLLACDVDASEIVQWIKTQVLWQLVIVILLVTVGMVVYITVIKTVERSFVTYTG